MSKTTLQDLPFFQSDSNSEGGGGGVSDHSQLSNLDFENSGHTGFESTNNKVISTEMVEYIDSDDKYPTVKAVGDYVSTKIGDIDSIVSYLESGE